MNAFLLLRLYPAVVPLHAKPPPAVLPRLDHVDLPLLSLGLNLGAAAEAAAPAPTGVAGAAGAIAPGEGAAAGRGAEELYVLGAVE